MSDMWIIVILGFVIGAAPGMIFALLYNGKSYDNGYNKGRKDGWYEGYEDGHDDAKR